MSVSQFQQFTPRRMKRSELREADYNPREICPSSYDRLKANLKRVGLIEPVVVNVRGGRNVVVGGHQRLAAMDELSATEDYTLDVAAIDVDERTELELNVFLNNPNAQGHWDLPKLAQLLREGAGVPEMGFNNSELRGLLLDAPQAEIADVMPRLAVKRPALEPPARAVTPPQDAAEPDAGDDDEPDGEELEEGDRDGREDQPTAPPVRLPQDVEDLKEQEGEDAGEWEDPEGEEWSQPAPEPGGPDPEPPAPPADGPAETGAHFLIACPDRDTRVRLLRALNLPPDARYITLAQLQAAIG